MVVPQHLAEKVKSLFVSEGSVGLVDELFPLLLGEVAEDVVEVTVKLDLVLLNVLEQFSGSEHLGDFNKLIVVVFTLEEGLLLEDHASEHAAEGPDVERVVVDLEVDEEFRSLEVSTGDTDIVLLTGVVEFSETPINKAEFTAGVVNHNVMRLDISVHNSLRMAEVQGLEDLEHVEADVEVSETFVKCAEINIAGVNELHDEGGSLGHRVSDDINQVDNVNSSLDRLQNFDLTSNLGFLNGLQDFNNDALVVRVVDPFVHF